MEEIWKDIEEYEGIYQVSNYGRIKSLSRLIENSNNRTTKEKIKKETKDKDGYLLITLSKNGIKKTCKVHRLVAQAFIPNPLNKRTVNHKDGNKQNNILDNLEWMTDKEQMKHCKEVLGWNPSKTKKSTRKVQRSDGKIYNSIKEASIDNNVFASNITMCCQQKCNTIGGYGWSYYE